jgi:beta-glucosidase
MENTSKFPEGFFWGSSTSSYQVEGGIENNDWAEAARFGRVPAAGLSADHYQFFEKDFDIAKTLGQNAHRLSLEWARIEPEEGVFNEEAFLHYEQVLDALRRRGMEPFVTLWHFTLPQWFARKGGFASSDAVFVFERYVRTVMARLGDKARFWITINEPMVYASDSYLQGKWPPFQRKVLTHMKVISNLVKAHKRAYATIKYVKPNVSVGIAKNNICFESTMNPFRMVARFFIDWWWNRRFLNKIKNFQDFVGLNYYMYVKFGGKRPTKLTDMGWQISPRGFYKELVALKRFGKPIYVTENGVADKEDLMREQYIKDHCVALKQAIDEGVPVRGYFYWSLLDNFEWAHGYDKRFGLVEINYDTMERKIRRSEYAYQRICISNEIA